MKKPFYITAIWRNKRLVWVGVTLGGVTMWTVLQRRSRKGRLPVGHGDTKDEAFEDWKQQVEGN